MDIAHINQTNNRIIVDIKWLLPKSIIVGSVHSFIGALWYKHMNVLNTWICNESLWLLLLPRDLTPFQPLKIMRCNYMLFLSF